MLTCWHSANHLVPYGAARHEVKQLLCTLLACTPCTLRRTLRTKFVELEQQLDAAQRAQHADADRCRHLESQVERLQGRLKDSSSKQAELSQQLW